MNLLQMVPLDEAGMFKVLQMVNDNGTEKPLKDDVLKRAFNKWWPDLRDELAKMKVPQKQPEKSDRPVEGMLDEILTLVRSIDKVTNRQLALSDILSSTRWSAPSVYSAGLSEIAKHAAEGLALKRKLVSEVQKTDSGLAQVVSDRDATYDSETLKILLSALVPEQRLAQVKEAADRIGIKVAFSWVAMPVPDLEML